MRRVLKWLLITAVLLVGVAWWVSRVSPPGPFYEPPASVPATPGALLREEPFERFVPADARGWRILYTTTHADGTPAVDSAVVLAPRTPSPVPQPVLAWAHGTSGIVPGCAPSILNLDPARYTPAWTMAPAEGWILVEPDYPGLGTGGIHEYLIGEAEARTTLDAVRAARQIRGLSVADRTVVWGHSQGGHAAMWTGIVAPAYAPDVPIAGVAGLAPATDLPALFDAIHRTVGGRVLTALAFASYARAYPDVRFEDEVRAVARPIARDIASRCTYPGVFSQLEALALGDSILNGSPASGAFGRRLAENRPDRPIAAPLFVAQAMADDTITPALQDAYVARRCAAGQALTYARYGERDHMGLVAPDSPLRGDLLQWTRDRFAGTPAPTGCSTLQR